MEFVHGDVRTLSDLLAVDGVEAIVECSAEPSALAGIGEEPSYVVDSNLTGAYHCLEFARRCGAQLVFLSTSRVYPWPSLREIRIGDGPMRFELEAEQTIRGVSEEGISEDFPLTGPRTRSARPNCAPNC